MKLHINNQEILVDFKYTSSTRHCRKGEKDESRKMVRHSFEKSVIQTIVTTCTISFDALNKVTESVKCDAKNHNREFARKYSLQKALKSFTKEFRTEVWKKYFEYIAKDKVEYLGINGFGFQNINGIITIDSRDKKVVFTPEQKQLLIKLLK